MLIHSCLKFPSFLYSLAHYSKSSTTWWQGNGNTNSFPEVWDKTWFKVVIITFILIIQIVLGTKMSTKLFLLKNHELSYLGNIDFIIYWVTCLISMEIIRLHLNSNKNDNIIFTSTFEVALSVLWLLLSFILYLFLKLYILLTLIFLWSYFHSLVPLLCCLHFFFLHLSSVSPPSLWNFWTARWSIVQF